MTSQDFNTLTLLLDKHFAQTQAQIATMQKENAEFREQIRQDINSFKSEVNNEFNKIHVEIADLRADVRVQSTRIDDLVHWNYWMITFIIALFMLPSIIDGTKAFFKALTDGVISLFRRKSK